jgi:hypothetical protein
MMTTTHLWPTLLFVRGSHPTPILTVIPAKALREDKSMRGKPNARTSNEFYSKQKKDVDGIVYVDNERSWALIAKVVRSQVLTVLSQPKDKGRG